VESAATGARTVPRGGDPVIVFVLLIVSSFKEKDASSRMLVI